MRRESTFRSTSSLRTQRSNPRAASRSPWVGRVGAKDYSSAPLTEPDVRATHPALWIDISEVQRELNRNLRAVKPRRRRDRSFSRASLFCNRKFRGADASERSAFPSPEGLSANTKLNCRGPVFLNPSPPWLRWLSPASSLL